MKQGEAGNDFFIILEGTAIVSLLLTSQKSNFINNRLCSSFGTNFFYSKKKDNFFTFLNRKKFFMSNDAIFFLP